MQSDSSLTTRDVIALFPGYGLHSTLKNSLGETQAESFLGQQENRPLRVTLYAPIGRERARQLMQSEKSQIEGIYRTDILPYYEQVSRLTGCPESAKPKFQEQSEGSDLDLIAQVATSDRFVYGICDTKAIAYRAQFRYLYCEKWHSLLVAKLFVPAGSIADAAEIKRLNCGNLASR